MPIPEFSNEDKAMLDQARKQEENLDEEAKKDAAIDQERGEYFRTAKERQTIQKAMSGPLPEPGGPGDPGVPPGDIPDESTDKAEITWVPLSDETKTALNDIVNLPPSERRKAVSDLLNSKNDSLGNQTQEGKNIQLDTEIHRGGKGVTIHEPQGNEWVISYEDEE